MELNNSEDIKKQYECMFPNVTLLGDIMQLNNQQLQSFFKIFFRFIVIQAVLVVIFVSSPSSSLKILAIINGVIFVGFVLMLCITLLKISKKKKGVFTLQLNALINNKDDKRIKLHMLFKNYEKKWNQIYLIELLVIVICNAFFNINNAIRLGYLDLSSMLFLLFLTGLFPIFITIVFNISDHRKYRQAAQKIELKLNETISVEHLNNQ